MHDAVIADKAAKTKTALLIWVQIRNLVWICQAAVWKCQDTGKLLIRTVFGEDDPYMEQFVRGVVRSDTPNLTVDMAGDFPCKTCWWGNCFFVLKSRKPSMIIKITWRTKGSNSFWKNRPIWLGHPSLKPPEKRGAIQALGHAGNGWLVNKLSKNAPEFLHWNDT